MLAGADSLNHITHTQEFKDLLSTVTAPWWVPTGIAGIALLTYLAHGHGEDAA